MCAKFYVMLNMETQLKIVESISSRQRGEGQERKFTRKLVKPVGTITLQNLAPPSDSPDDAGGIAEETEQFRLQLSKERQSESFSTTLYPPNKN